LYLNLAEFDANPAYKNAYEIVQYVKQWPIDQIDVIVGIKIQRGYNKFWQSVFDIVIKYRLLFNHTNNQSDDNDVQSLPPASSSLA
jgi:hypothetical protein